jgi:hypothetical protein
MLPNHMTLLVLQVSALSHMRITPMAIPLIISCDRTPHGAILSIPARSLLRHILGRRKKRCQSAFSTCHLAYPRKVCFSQDNANRCFLKPLRCALLSCLQQEHNCDTIWMLPFHNFRAHAFQLYLIYLTTKSTAPDHLPTLLSLYHQKGCGTVSVINST